MCWQVIAQGTDRCNQVRFEVEWTEGTSDYRFHLVAVESPSRPELPPGFYHGLNGELEAITELTDDMRREIMLHMHQRRFQGEIQ